MAPLAFDIGPDATKDAAIRLGCAVIIPDEQGRILLQKRTDGDWWSLPAGGMEPGETPIQTAIRETREETGLEIAIDRFLGVYTDPDICTVYPDGRRVQIVSIFFLARITGGRLIESNEETAALAWFSPNALPHNLTPTSRHRIQRYLADPSGCHVD